MPVAEAPGPTPINRFVLFYALAWTGGAIAYTPLLTLLLPLAMPGVIATGIYIFITSWNEFLGAIVMMSKASAFTLPVILAAARTETSLGGTDWGMLQAGITVAMTSTMYAERSVAIIVAVTYMMGKRAED